jgi:prephenate dehydrogenase
MNTIESNFNMQKKLSSLTYGFFGLGLMGGSLAKAIRNEILNKENSQGRILASDCRIQTLEEAQKEKIIDKFYSVEETQKMLSECDIVFICLYPKATKEFIKKWVMEGPTHHYALGVGHKAEVIKKIADILDIPAVIVK